MADARWDMLVRKPASEGHCFYEKKLAVPADSPRFMGRGKISASISGEPLACC